MAIYHCSLRIFSRSEGHSAVAAAAYRSGAVLKDERSGRMHRYEKRRGVIGAFILAPQSAPQNLLDRALLWNAAEASETRKNSRVAREVILALPHELDHTERQALARDMALYLVERYRVAVDVAIHTPVAGDGHDPRNHHAHLLFTTREITEDGMGAKTRILDDKESGPQEVELLREVWEALANDALARAGFPNIKIDRRTLEDQGIDRIPQTHIGNTATHAEEEAFRKRQADAEEEDEGEEGKTDQAGSGDSKGISPAGGIKVLDQARTRADFVQEIKKLNQQRAAFSPVPLKTQIEKIDGMIDVLDGRLEKLKKLSEKTRLPGRLQRTIVSLLDRAKDALLVREQARAERQLSAAEKEARAERQKSRYGKTYRTGIHEQMREMQAHIQTLQAKEKEHKKYQTFVTMIEARINKLNADKPPVLAREAWPQRIITPEILKTKITAEAQTIRNKIPPDYKPRTTQESFITVFRTAQENQNPQGSIKFAKSFAAAASAPKRTDPNPPWRKEIVVKFKALDEARAERAITFAPKDLADPKQWRTPVSEKVQPFLDKIQREMQVARAQAAPEPTTRKSGLSAEFNNPQAPVKRTTNEQAIAKVKQEAERLRQTIPPGYRAKPYPTTEKPVETTKPKTEKTDIKNAFSQAVQNKVSDKPAPPQKMSDKFNVRSGFNSAAKIEASYRSDRKFEVEI